MEETLKHTSHQEWSISFQVHDILEKAKPRRQYLPGISREKGTNTYSTGFQGNENIPYDAVTVDSLVFVKTHRMYNIKS
jgi:hypothetical protein